MVDEQNTNAQHSFSIGTPSGGGNIKVYFSKPEEAEALIDWAVTHYHKLLIAKSRQEVRKSGI